MESLDQIVKEVASVLAAQGALAWDVRNVEIVLQDREVGLEFGEGCFEELLEQHRDQVGALVDLLAAGVGLSLVGWEGIRELADPFEAELRFVSEILFVGAPVVLFDVGGEGPAVEGALTGELENVERDAGGGGALGHV